MVVVGVVKRQNNEGGEGSDAHLGVPTHGILCDTKCGGSFAGRDRAALWREVLPVRLSGGRSLYR